MNLAQFLGESSDYIQSGEHELTIRSIHIRRCNSGTEVVEFRCENADRQRTSASFFLTQDSLKAGYLARFAVACGMTPPELLTYQHEQLVGRRFFGLIGVKEGGKYAEVLSYKPARPGQAKPAPAPQPPTGDDIPF
jgi:hypothetical protein